MVVLGITIWKARPVRVEGVKFGVKSTVTSILMRDGVLYFGVLLIANLIGLIIVRFFVFIQPINTWIAMLTSIMTSRFILDLREAADPGRYYDDLSTNGGGISTLVFPSTSKPAPCFDFNPPSSTTNTACSAGVEGAKWDSFEQKLFGGGYRRTGHHGVAML
ncbi:uncharacterized protein TRAVEDRAFT_51249 [Trametes versicolor FP-101664 SS1]|uniref:uncharacterized protein n=1 Tax=Trametes versicolor (strain FP-101664) TaxID=717944 RepID=UPI000462413E|nr:uncharacterized protein TRAVEDRAFT_51249 [Trametes versicolor FP-101664 SS1]EIW55125.1 hypothetical protein TRAVEDRAFT_51249 [Trametes versicolor FP-101664 SS1]